MNSARDLPLWTQMLIEKAARLPVYYVANPGNAGDALIGLGMFSVLRRVGLKIEFWDPSAQPKQPWLALYAGGGALVDLYRKSESRFLSALSTCDEMLILPHTIRKFPDAATEYLSKISVFAREMHTLSYLHRIKDLRFVGIDHDLALNLTNGDLIDAQKGFLAKFILGLLTGDLYSRARIVKRSKTAIPSKLRVSRYLKSSNGVLNCFRRDAEGTSAGRNVVDNFDLSYLFMVGTESQAAIELSANLLLKTIDASRGIDTNRLHCCIAAALLGRSVNFYANSYYKNRAIFEYSLQQRFTGINWCEV